MNTYEGRWVFSSVFDGQGKIEKEREHEHEKLGEEKRISNMEGISLSDSR
jgi:hypothetical protein